MQIVERLLSRQRVHALAALLDPDARLDDDAAQVRLRPFLAVVMRLFCDWHQVVAAACRPSPVQLIDDLMGGIVADATAFAADVARARQAVRATPALQQHNLVALVGEHPDALPAAMLAPPLVLASDVQLYVQEVKRGYSAALRPREEGWYTWRRLQGGPDAWSRFLCRSCLLSCSHQMPTRGLPQRRRPSPSHSSSSTGLPRLLRPAVSVAARRTTTCCWQINSRCGCSRGSLRH